MTESNIFISKATQRNWDKLKNGSSDRLTRRANKSRSQKIITPEGYVMAGSLPRFVEELKEADYHINDLIFSLCALYLEHNKANEVNKSRFFEEYTKTLRQIRDDAKERMITIAATFFDTLEQENLTVSDLKNGSRGVSGYFLKLRNEQFDPSVLNKTAAKAMEEPKDWYKKDHPRAEDLHYLADQVLIPLLRYAEKEREQQWRLYQSAKLTLSHQNANGRHFV